MSIYAIYKIAHNCYFGKVPPAPHRLWYCTLFFNPSTQRLRQMDPWVLRPA